MVFDWNSGNIAPDCVKQEFINIFQRFLVIRVFEILSLFLEVFYRFLHKKLTLV